MTGKKPEQRWNNGKGYKNNVEFYTDIIKYGWDNFIKIVLYENLSKERAELLETKLIYLFDSVENGYNISYGIGSKGLKISDEHRSKLKKIKGKDHPNAKKVICITTNRIFDSIVEASNFYNIKGHHISECCLGKRKTAGKLNGVPLVWMYLKDYECSQLPFKILRIKSKFE